MKIYERIYALVLVLMMGVLLCSCDSAGIGNAVPAVEETTVTVEQQTANEPQSVVENIKLMFYTYEIEGNMTAMVGENIKLHAEVVSDSHDATSVEWESSCETSLRIEKGESPNEVNLKVLSTEKSPVMLTVSCGELKKVYPVYIKPAQDGSESAQPGEIRLMYYNTELGEFTLRAGETVQLYAEIDGVPEPEFVWTSSDESSLTIEHRFDDTRDAWLTAEKAVEGGLSLTLSCGEIEKAFTVYICPAG